MASCFGCLKLALSGERYRAAPLVQKDPPGVKIDTTNLGSGVVVVKQGRRVCGTGGALANSPIVQDKAYFEGKLQSTGQWSLGLARQTCDVNAPLGLSADSWVLDSSGSLLHEGNRLAVQPPMALSRSGSLVPALVADGGKAPNLVEEGDVIGVTYDHEELCFYLNGKKLAETMTGLRGTLYPVVYVDDGAIFDINFSDFAQQPPQGFEQIMIEKSLL